MINLKHDMQIKHILELENNWGLVNPSLGLWISLALCVSMGNVDLAFLVNVPMVLIVLWSIADTTSHLEEYERHKFIIEPMEAQLIKMEKEFNRTQSMEEKKRLYREGITIRERLAFEKELILS